MSKKHNFYKGRLTETYGLNVLIPAPSDRKIIHDVIFDELCMGRYRDASRNAYLRIIDHLSQNGAQAIILGCTEIGLLINQGDTKVTLYDTTAIHADKAVQFALKAD